MVRYDLDDKEYECSMCGGSGPCNHCKRGRELAQSEIWKMRKGIVEVPACARRDFNFQKA